MSIQSTVEALISPITLEEPAFLIFTEKWQNLLYEGLNITPTSITTEADWPYLGNLLISYLVVRDLVYKSLNVTALSASQGSGATGLAGGIKKIETGPVNAERHDGGVSMAKLYESLFNKEGLWEELQLQICGIASKLNIHVTGCKEIVNIPIKVIRGSDYSYEDQYPITPATLEKTP